MSKKTDIFLQKLREIQSGGRRPKLLLHACCAPCSTHVMQLLWPVFDISVFFCNPNIQPEDEYARRLDELRGFIFKYYHGVQLFEVAYAPGEFYAAAAGLEDCPERGERCAACYRLRLSKTGAFANANGYEYFTSTLSVSPHKDAALLNEIGNSLGGQAKYLAADFKKRDGYLNSIRLSEMYGMYRQEYCGCRPNGNIGNRK